MLTNCLAACAQCPSKYDRFWDTARYWSKIAIFSYPPAFDAPVRGGGSRRYSAMTFGTEKLEWLGYPMVKKIRRYLYSFWRNSRTWQTDGQTDRHTDRHRMPTIAALMHNIARQKSDLVVWYSSEPSLFSVCINTALPDLLDFKERTGEVERRKRTWNYSVSAP